MLKKRVGSNNHYQLKQSKKRYIFGKPEVTIPKLLTSKSLVANTVVKPIAVTIRTTYCN